LTLRQKEKEYKEQINRLLKEGSGRALTDPVRSHSLTLKPAALQAEWPAMKTSLLAMIAYLKSLDK